MTRPALILALLAAPAMAHHDHGPAPRPFCVGPLELADVDSSPRQPQHCPTWRLPGVDACELSTPKGQRDAKAARAAFHGVTVRIDLTAPTDRFGRLLTAPTLLDGRSYADEAAARGWTAPRQWNETEREWMDPAPECGE